MTEREQPVIELNKMKLKIAGGSTTYLNSINTGEMSAQIHAMDNLLRITAEKGGVEALSEMQEVVIVERKNEA